MPVLKDKLLTIQNYPLVLEAYLKLHSDMAYSQKELAEEFNTHPSTISRWAEKSTQIEKISVCANDLKLLIDKNEKCIQRGRIIYYYYNDEI